MQENSHFTLTGPLIWCDNLQVRLWMILNINYNVSHHMGMSQMCTGADHYFRSSKPHSGKLCAGFMTILWSERISLPIIVLCHEFRSKPSEPFLRSNGQLTRCCWLGAPFLDPGWSCLSCSLGTCCPQWCQVTHSINYIFINQCSLINVYVVKSLAEFS